MIGFPVKDSSNPRFDGWFFLDPSVVLGRELAPFRDHQIRPIQKLFIPAVFFGLSLIRYALTPRHDIMVGMLILWNVPLELHGVGPGKRIDLEPARKPQRRVGRVRRSRIDTRTI